MLKSKKMQISDHKKDGLTTWFTFICTDVALQSANRHATNSEFLMKKRTNNERMPNECRTNITHKHENARHTKTWSPYMRSTNTKLSRPRTLPNGAREYQSTSQTNCWLNENRPAPNARPAHVRKIDRRWYSQHHCVVEMPGWCLPCASNNNNNKTQRARCASPRLLARWGTYYQFKVLHLCKAARPEWYILILHLDGPSRGTRRIYA